MGRRSVTAQVRAGETRVCSGGTRVYEGVYWRDKGGRQGSVLEGEGEGVYLGKERVSFRDKADH